MPETDGGTNGATRFELRTRWTFETSVQAVWTEIVERADVNDWDGCLRADPVDGWTPGVGDRIRFEVTGALPWSLDFTIRIDDIQAPNRCRVSASGDVVGTGRWRIDRAVDHETVATFTWWVGAADPRIGRVSTLPVVRRIVEWNHDVAMASWRRAIDARLARSIEG